MIHKKKLKQLETNLNTTPYFSPIDRQNKYIDLFRNSLKPQTVDLKMSDAEGLRRAYNTDKGIYTFGDRMYIAGAKSFGDVKDGIF